MSRPPTKPNNVENYATFDSSNSDSDGSGRSSIHGTDYNENSRLRPHPEPSYDRARRISYIEEDEDPLQLDLPTRVEKTDQPVTWKSLPHKRQLAILVTARLSEPLVQSSLRVYIRLSIMHCGMVRSL